MGLKFFDGTNWKTVTAPAKVSTNGGTTWQTAKKMSFLDPVTGNYMKAVWGDVAPSVIVTPVVTFAWTGSAYTATARWTQVVDTEGDFSTIQAEKTTGGVVTTTSAAYSTLTHPAGITNFALGTISDAGYTQIAWRFRIGDVGGQFGAYVAAATVRVPPGPVTNLVLSPVWNGTKYIIRATWIGPNATLSSYRLVHNKGAGDTTINSILDQTYDIAGVASEGGSTYTVSVYAIGSDAVVSPVTSATITLPPDPPASLTVSGLNTATATLTWTAPANGVRTGYQYRTSTNGGVSYSAWTAVGPLVLSATTNISGISTLISQVQTLNSTSGQTNSFETTASSTVGVPTPVTPTLTFANNNVINVSWAGSSTTNVSSWRVFLSVNGGASTQYASGIPPGTTSFSYNVGLNNNTAQSAIIVAVHSNGQTASSASGSATTASTIGAITPSFVARAPRASWTHVAGNTSYTVTSLNSSTGGGIEQATVSAGAGGVLTWISTATGSYADDSFYFIAVQGSSASGSAAVVYSSSIKKVPNPIVFNAAASDTWRGGSQRTDVGSNLYQGATANGVNYGAFYYNGALRSQLHSSVIGYTLGITSATIFFIRMTSGSSAATPVWATLHGVRTKGSADPTPTRSTPSTNIGTLQTPPAGGSAYYGQKTISTTWIDELISEATYLGIGVYDNNNTLTGVAPNQQSADYASYNDSSVFILFVGTSGAITITHNG